MSDLARVTTYSVFDQATGTDQLYAQRYAGNGSTIGQPIQVSTPDFPVGEEYGVYTQILSDGGFVVLFTTPGEQDVFPANILLQQYNSGGQDVSGLTFLQATDQGGGSRDSISTLALESGGYAILLNHYQAVQDTVEITTTGYFGSSSGAIGQQQINFIDEGGDGPFPHLIETEPTMQLGPNNTVIVNFNEMYTPPNPDFPSDTPTTTEHFAYTYSASGALLSQHIVDFDGNAETISYGALQQKISDYIRHPDGSFETDQYALTGDYQYQFASYDAQGHLLSMTREYSNQVVAMTQVISSDGSQQVEDYDTLGRNTTSADTNADGSRSITTRTFTGTDDNPTTILNALFDTKGKIIQSDMTNVDGTHVQTAYQANATLTSTATVSDILVGASIGNDIFAFTGEFGQDTVRNFKAGSAVGHDVIQIDAAAIPDFQHLQAHISAAANGTLITVGTGETILLQGISPSLLTSDDFFFKH